MAPIIYKRQGQILDFIKQHIQTHGAAPTLRQIANAIGVSSLATVHEHLAALEEKGLIKRKSGKTRSIELSSSSFRSSLEFPSTILLINFCRFFLFIFVWVFAIKFFIEYSINFPPHAFVKVSNEISISQFNNPSFIVVDPSISISSVTLLALRNDIASYQWLVGVLVGFFKNGPRSWPMKVWLSFT